MNTGIQRRQFIKAAAIASLYGSLAEITQAGTGGEKMDRSRTVKDCPPTATSATILLDGNHWLLATDPENIGQDRRWYEAPRPDARPTPVPWVIQDIFPGYHGMAWYWCKFSAPLNPDPHGRHLLRFWAVNYLAEVWVNGVHVGGHEGSETPFTLDVTSAIQPAKENLLAVRVLNPGDNPIDGITLSQVPHRNQTSQFACGCDYDHGGIEDSVELLVTPAVRIDDVFVRADPFTGELRLRINVLNALAESANSQLEIIAAPAANGKTIAIKRIRSSFQPGGTLIEETLKLENPRLWSIDDPFLYRITVNVSAGDLDYMDEQSVRCGFRDFRLENGNFRLNGNRIYLKSSVSGDMAPIGIHVPYDRDWFRRDLIHSKTMGFNAIRFYGLPTRFQLDLCDEIGLMVYEEAFSSQGFQNSPQMAERFDRSTSGMILRDRNHPSVVIWGLLNETGDGPQFRHAVESLSMVRSLDSSRLVFLSSGRFDCDLRIGSISNPGSEAWQYLLGDEGASAPPREKEPMKYPSCDGAGDAHIYPQVPHNADAIHLLRTFGDNTAHKAVFLSEYGIASALDLTRVVHQYEQRGKGDCGECRFYRRALDQFLADWKRWRLEDTFGRPEDYFKQCLVSMAAQRLLGINALRSNPCIIGYDLTGTSDQGYTGEGLTTAFRELKPGTVDAIFDGLAPLRWCLFAEPINIYRGDPIQLEAVLANDDVLNPGVYPVRLEVIGPNANCVFEHRIDVTIADRRQKPEPPLALPAFAEAVTANWSSGKYRFVASFEKGAAAAGGEVEFFVTDPVEMPKVTGMIQLWGEDQQLVNWLNRQHISFEPFRAEVSSARRVILAGNKLPADGRKAFKNLAAQISRGSSVIFLDPEIFTQADQPASLGCIGGSGMLSDIPAGVYHKDDWTTKHAIFAGLPAGGLMDYTFYRDVIGSRVWQMDHVPDDIAAGAIYANTAYSSGLTVCGDKLGAGRIILNTLRIRENLSQSPVADRLLLNMLCYTTSRLKGTGDQTNQARTEFQYL